MKLKIVMLMTCFMVLLTSCPDDITEFEIIGWEPKNFPDLNLALSDIYFKDSSNGWVTAGFFRNYDPVNNFASIYKTTDGGNTWTEQKKIMQTYFYRIKFINDLTGFVIGKNDSTGVLLKTGDGGTTWNLVEINILDTNKNIGALRGIHFINDLTGWIVGTSGLVVKTYDGGLTWTKEKEFSLLHLLDINFFDSNNGIAVGGEDVLGYTTGHIFRTNDGGKTWDNVHNKTNALFRDCEIVNNTTGFAVGNNGYLVKTTDAGSTWTQINLKTENHFNGVFFIDENHGWVCGYYAQLYHTSNGGETWTKQVTDRRENFYNLYFLDYKHGWLVGTYGTLLYTFNSGIDVVKK